MDTKVTVKHSVYRPTCFHVSGARIEYDNLDVLLTSADRALRRNEGEFIQTFDERVVVGFLKEWSMDDGAPRGGEFFFDLFSLPLDDAKRVDLRALVDELSKHAVEDRGTDIEDSVVVSVPENTGRENDYHAIAEILHQLRSESIARASLDELTQLKNHVDGVLRHVSYVSDQKKETSQFNVVDGDRDGVIPDDDLVEALVNAEGPVQYEELHGTTDVEPDIAPSDSVQFLISDRQLLLVILTIQVVLLLLVLFDITFRDLYDLIVRIVRIGGQ